MRHRDVERLADTTYEVRIASEHRIGHMCYGEHVIPGRTGREFLLSAHICHPSLANDNCSGIAVLAELAKTLAHRSLRYTYRFIFAPGSIGALAWLARNEEVARRIDHGLVVSCVGDGGGPTYKCSRRGEADIDRAMRQVLSGAGPAATSSRLRALRRRRAPVLLAGVQPARRPVPAQRIRDIPQYHTSGDDLDFIRPEHLAASHDMIIEAIEVIEEDWTPLNLSSKGEPELVSRGLADPIGGSAGSADTMALRWVLSLADGWHSLLDIAERSGLSFRVIAAAADRLGATGLLADASTGRHRSQATPPQPEPPRASRERAGTD